MVRCKNRYFVLEINESNKSSTLELRPSSVYDVILHIIHYLHGDFGVAAIRTGFLAKYCNSKTRIAVIRCRRGPHKLVASAIPLITKLEGKSVKANTLYIGATIKHCFKYIQNYQQRIFDELCLHLETDEERASLKKAILNVDSVLDIGGT